MPETVTEATPSLGRRFGALLIDWVLCLLVAGFYADPRVVAWPPVVILILVYAVFLGFFAQTPGMRVMKLRCVDVDDNGSIGVLRGALRGFLLALVIPALIMDGQRRGLHDRAARSIVVPA
ncbi:RDD family protein [Allocatelliglobosispora scoriae]|nr:RDD family protein [Allocatelliglobosispora scoriae]